MVGWRGQVGWAGGDFGSVIVRVFKNRRWFGLLYRR